MINIPSNLQNAWDDVSKDGKIDKADVRKLIDAAAPGISGAKTASELDKALSTEINKDESDFLANFSSTENGSVLSVKNGTAKGTFEFVNTPQANNTKTGEAPLKLFEPLKLPDSSTPKENVKPETVVSTESANVPVQNSTIEDRIKKLQLLKDSLPNILKDPELSTEMAKIDNKIKRLAEKLVNEPVPKNVKEENNVPSGKEDKPPETVKKDVSEQPNVDQDKINEANKAKIQERNKANIKTTLEGLHDVIGNGFWNAENKEGTGAMFQLLAKQGILDETIKQMNPDDQKEAIKMLLSGTNVFNHSVAARIYDNLSKSANIDGEFKNKDLNTLHTVSRETDSFPIEPNQFYKGMQYSLFNEKEAAMTMARGIINGEISSSVLTKFSSNELNTMVKLVDKNGTQEEKENLAKVIAESYTNNHPTVKIDDLSKGTKAKIVKEVLATDNPDKDKMTKMVEQMGKDVIFEAVNKENLSDNQLVTLAKYTNGDAMADNVDAASKLLMAMIKTYNKAQKGPVSLVDINKFIDQVDKDWWSDDDVMRRLLKELADGPESEYAKFKALAPATIDKIWNISN